MYIPPREYNGVSYSTVLYMLDTYTHVNFIDILVYLILANDHMFKVDFLCPFQDDLSTIAMSMYLRINARKEELPSVVLLHTHQRSNRQKRDEYRWLRKTLTYPVSNLAMAHFSNVFKIQSLCSSTWSSEARW